jgi:Asp-tRNA(Asn)/Glu-tRNA(Gln) amidotransferase A subunit family amidase
VHGILEGEQPPDDTIRWLSHAGLMTRSIRDTALVLDVLAEHDDDRRVPTWRGALATRRALRVEADRKAIGDLAFKDIDVLVLPTTPIATPTVEDAANNSLALSSHSRCLPITTACLR